MATKKYTANSHVCLSVFMGDHSEHISFTSMTGGKSSFYTKDEKLQKALEHHSQFGRLFHLAADQPVDLAEQKKAEVATPANKANEPKKVKVSCLDDAKDYLAEKYNVSRTKLKGEKSIKAAAEANNIVFEGI